MINLGDGNNSTAENIPAQNEENNQERHSFLPTTITISNQCKEGFIPIIEGTDSGFFKLVADPLGFEQLFGVPLSENPVLTNLLPPSELEKFQHIITSDLSNPSTFNKNNYSHFTIVTPAGEIKRVFTSTKLLHFEERENNEWNIELEMVFIDVTDILEPLLTKEENKQLPTMNAFMDYLRTELSIQSSIINIINAFIKDAINDLEDPDKDISTTRKKLERILTYGNDIQVTISSISSAIIFLQEILDHKDTSEKFSLHNWVDIVKTRSQVSNLLIIGSLIDYTKVFVNGTEQMLDRSVRQILEILIKNQNEGSPISFEASIIEDGFITISLKATNSFLSSHLKHLSEYLSTDDIVDPKRIVGFTEMTIKRIINQIFKGTTTLNIDNPKEIEWLIKIPVVRELLES